MEAITRPVALLLLLVTASVSASSAAGHGDQRLSGGSGGGGGWVVEEGSRRTVAAGKAGTVTAVDVADAAGAAYRLQFITMDPSSLFLPVLLHADMVFFVHTGRGRVSYVDEESSKASSIEVERGDVYSLEQGTAFYIRSHPSATRERLRIYAIFTSDTINAENPLEPMFEAYSNISDLIRGFDDDVLRVGFGVSREVVEAIKSATRPPAIIHYTPEDEKKKSERTDWREDAFEALLGVRDPHLVNKKKDKDKSKSKAFNFYSGKPDVENCYGWSRAMTGKDLRSLKGTNIGMFMVNLTTGSMMGPHWNPRATEIAVVTHGRGMVQVVCPTDPSGRSKSGGDRCKRSVFRVNEGDVFAVPRFHPMAQISFNNDSFVFVGFSTDVGRNHPQFLAGKQSVLQVIDKDILARSLGATNGTVVKELLSAQRDAIILGCTSCAEDLERETEAAARKERQEEEERRKRREEEEQRRREEEERKRREEEERRRREEEEERRRREEEEERRREKEQQKKRGEEEERARREEEQREEEERARREEEEQRERKRREEEEERRREEEQKKKREEEEERARREEEQTEEEERARREEEEQRERREGEKKREEEEEEEEWGKDEYGRLRRLSKHVREGRVASRRA